MALIPAWTVIVISIAAAEGIQESSNSSGTNRTIEPPPVHSMHRLIPAVLDTFSFQTNQSEKLFPGNVTLDTTPFLPSGVISSYRNFNHYQENNSNLPALKSSTNFTPSFFIGEVIPEPYIPERFQTSRSGETANNSSNRSYQKLVPSQTAFAFHKILPFIEQMKQAVGHSLEVGHENEHAFDHAPPVHEPSMEDEDMTTPKYVTSYEEDQHSDRPSYRPYFHGAAVPQNIHSTKPITFENSGQNYQQDSLEYYPHDIRSNSNDYYGYGGHVNPYTSNEAHGFNATSSYLKGQTDHHSGPYFAQDNYEYHQQKDHLDHFSHHEADLVLPSPFYPPEPEHPTAHHKEIHYKVHQNKFKNPLHGLLHFAAALIPLGLFVAALQPSVIHVNSSQPMPTKYRSAEGESERAALGLPGLEVLERLGLGNLDQSDCEKRAFCELAVLGGKPEGNTAQKGLWKLANNIPEQYASSLRLEQVLKAVKSNSCISLKCLGSDQTTQVPTSTP